MNVADDLRKQAALCRRAAIVKTTGSARADRVLVELAAQFERHADVADVVRQQLAGTSWKK
jgi:hypothetical protein